MSSAKEDLLTADVFGVLKYLPRQPYLASVLQAVADRAPAGREFRSWSRGAMDLASWSFAFWPSYPTPAAVAGASVEPDVALHGREGLIFVEAKLHSNFGVQQIEKQLLTGLEQAGEQPFYLILITRGS